MIDVAHAWKQSGDAGFVDINDNATARAAASALMLAVEIERNAAVETIPHLTTRDATIMGLESQLLGAHACGIRNVLAVTGDPPEVGDYPGSRGVYEIDSIGLTHLMPRLNRGEDYNGRAIDAATSFHIGVAVNPAADDLESELDRFHRKIEAGAHFAMTQILFDLEYMDRFVERLGGEWPIPVLVGIFPVWSHQLALRLHNEVPGIVVPQPVLDASATPGRVRPRSGWRSAASCSRLTQPRRRACTSSRRSAGRSGSSTCCRRALVLDARSGRCRIGVGPRACVPVRRPPLRRRPPRRASRARAARARASRACRGSR